MRRLNQKTKIFLIHAHSDRETVHGLYQHLVRDGLNVWLDAERLQPGQDWQNEIRNAILHSEIVLVCISREFDKKPGYRHEELKLALEKANFLPDHEVFIIPVRLEQCEVPESLHRLHRVDLFKAGGYKRLIQALRKRM